MNAIPAGALAKDQVTLVPKRLLRDILETFNTLELSDVTDIYMEIQGILNPGNPKYRKKR